MKKEYDFSNGVRGKFHRPKKVQKTLRIDEDILNYFNQAAKRTGIPYQTLINMCLRKFANEESELVIHLDGNGKKTG
ncbi:MAG: BrnA antitoxin family protein [Pseudobdellovibrionaceae bacterium]|nr:BrnA antitoxin family protein [Bdellovibrionales bacterium]USN48775.1 MAG: BrnA antitoxin family protein [Pseudobdellovibrionaceae bacterium]